MSWPSRFLAVPTSALTLGGERVAATDKATPAQLAGYVAQVPAVYERLAAGFTAADFEKMRTAPLNDQERAIGETYAHLYSPARADSRLEAEFQDGVGLVVTRGRHRFDAARQLGVEVLPVHVRAPDPATLDRISAQLEAEVARTAPQVVEQQRALDDVRRAATQGRRPSPDGERVRQVEPERQHGWER